MKVGKKKKIPNKAHLSSKCPATRQPNQVAKKMIIFCALFSMVATVTARSRDFFFFFPTYLPMYWNNSARAT
jgi:hypothetical protein